MSKEVSTWLIGRSPSIESGRGQRDSHHAWRPCHEASAEYTARRCSFCRCARMNRTMGSSVLSGPSPYDCYSGGTPRWSIARCKSTKYACSKTSVRHALRRHQDGKIWQQVLTPVVGRKRQIRNNLRGRKVRNIRDRPSVCRRGP